MRARVDAPFAKRKLEDYLAIVAVRRTNEKRALAATLDTQPTMEADAFHSMMAVTTIRPTGSVDACLNPPAFGSASMEVRRPRVRQQPGV